jgi:hypothetical protein
VAYDNTNRGALFKNAEKENPKHADYKGNINVNGEEFWLDAWINESKNGMKYMSLSIKPKKAAAKASNTKASAGIDYNDEIPFAPEWR